MEQMFVLKIVANASEMEHDLVPP